MSEGIQMPAAVDVEAELLIREHLAAGEKRTGRPWLRVGPEVPGGLVVLMPSNGREEKGR